MKDLIHEMSFKVFQIKLTLIYIHVENIYKKKYILVKKWQWQYKKKKGSTWRTAGNWIVDRNSGDKVGIDIGIILYPSKTNMSGNYSSDINNISSKLKDIFTGNVVMVKSFKFWK